jgi:hypothetical protein
MGSKTMKAADALKLFGKTDIQVQEAKPVKLKGDDGKERPGFKTEMKPLAEKHILSAKEHDDGRVTIVTIDGRRHEARA